MEILVIGLGRFGVSVATALSEQGVVVTAIDQDSNKVKNVLEYVDNGFILDATDKKALMELSVEHYDKVIVALGKGALNASLLTALNLLELGVEDIIAKASSFEHYKLLDKIGVHKVVQPEYDMGKKIATKISGKCVVDYVELSNDVKIDNVRVNKIMKKIQNKTIQEINLRKRFQVNIIGIQRGDEIVIPDSGTKILDGDVLIIIGKKEKISDFEKFYKIV